METISISVNENDILPCISGVNLLPVYTLNGFGFSRAVPLETDAIPALNPYGLFLNRLFHEAGLAALREVLESSLLRNAEQISFADPAVLFLADESLWKKLIYRPETLLACSKDAEFWKNTGIRGVSLSPVITALETEAILREVTGCEVMIHGHPLLSVSARRLLTAYHSVSPSFDPESRHLFLEEETRKEKMPVFESEYGTMICSGTELETFDRIRGFQDAGASQYFIQGEGMPAEDLETVLRIYADLLTGKDAASAITQYRILHPQCTEGSYAESTIL